MAGETRSRELDTSSEGAELDSTWKERAVYVIGALSSVIGLGAAVWLWWWVGTRPRGCAHLQSAAALAGSPNRFDDYVNSGSHPGATCVTTSLGAAHGALWMNALLGVFVAVLAFVLLSSWLRRASFTARARTWVWRSSFLPLVAGVLNVAQVIVTHVGLYRSRSTTGLHPALRLWAARFLPILAWPKLVFFVVGLLVLVFEMVATRGNVLSAFVRASAPTGRGVWRLLTEHLHFLEHPHEVVGVEDDAPPVGGVGISCSGGGIRAGSITLGVLSSLESHLPDGTLIDADHEFDGKRSILDRSTYLASVSGGGYTAAAWRIAHGPQPVTAQFTTDWPRGIIGDPWSEVAAPAETYDSDAPGPPPTLYRHIRARHEYLRTGRGGLAWSAIRALGYLVFQLALLGAIVMLVAWPAGRLSRTWYVYGGIGCRTTQTGAPAIRDGDLGSGVCGSRATADACTAPPADPYLQHSLGRARCFVERAGVQMPITWSLAGTPILLSGAALVVFLPTLAAMRTRRRRTVRLIALALAGVAVTAGVVFLGVPLLLDVAYPYVSTPLGIALVSSAASGTGIAATILRFLRVQLTRRIDLLGKALVLVAALLFGIIVAGQAAIGEGVFALPAAGWLSGFAGYLVLAVVMFVAFFAFDPRSWSLHVIYRNRLRNTFSTTRSRDQARRSVIFESSEHDVRILPLSGMKEPTLDAYVRGTGPTHLVCCSAARSSNAVSGIPALSFVFSPTEVALYEPHYDGQNVGSLIYRAPTKLYMHALRTSSSHLHATGTVTAAVAMSGAAVASAMGSFDPREPTSLFAVLNLRLGVWMPNPALVGLGAPKLFKTRLSYLLKEIVGYFELDDRHLYITDGGHRENLGLVELLRRRCKTIICIDASGDEPGSFATLRKALAMARIELGITFDPKQIPDPPKPGTAVPLEAVGHRVIVVEYRPTPTEKSKGTNTTATIVYLGAELYEQCPTALRAFGNEDPDFPHYSTGNQFLSDTQFVNLVKFGRALGDSALAEPVVTNAVMTGLATNP
jgi:hypothetical protein